MNVTQAVTNQRSLPHCSNFACLGVLTTGLKNSGALSGADEASIEFYYLNALVWRSEESFDKFLSSTSELIPAKIMSPKFVFSKSMLWTSLGLRDGAKSNINKFLSFEQQNEFKDLISKLSTDPVYSLGRLRRTPFIDYLKARFTDDRFLDDAMPLSSFPFSGYQWIANHAYRSGKLKDLLDLGIKKDREVAVSSLGRLTEGDFMEWFFELDWKSSFETIAKKLKFELSDGDPELEIYKRIYSLESSKEEAYRVFNVLSSEIENYENELLRLQGKLKKPRKNILMVETRGMHLRRQKKQTSKPVKFTPRVIEELIREGAALYLRLDGMGIRFMEFSIGGENGRIPIWFPGGEGSHAVVPVGIVRSSSSKTRYIVAQNSWGNETKSGDYRSEFILIELSKATPENGVHFHLMEFY